MHQALHHAPAFAALADGTLDQAEGAGLMHRLWRFYSAADPLLSGACQRLAMAPNLYAYAPRLPHLAEWAGSPADPPPAMPTLDTPAARAGAAYVLDGALLGGSVLDRASRNMDWIGGYWRWCRSDGGRIWQRTLAFLGTIPEPQHAAALTAARETFGAFRETVTTAPGGGAR